MLLSLYPFVMLAGIASLFFQFLVFRNERKGGYMYGSYMLTVIWSLFTVVLLFQSYTSYLTMLDWLNRDSAIPYPDPNPGTIYQNNISAAIPSTTFLLIIVLSTIRYTLSYRKRRAAW